MTHEVVRTTSGALAIRDVDVGEVMHPGVGPRVEAEALYVRQSRLEERLNTGASLRLFDVGLGAGSNALAARAVAERSTGHLTMISFERDLGALALALQHGSDFGLVGENAEAARALMTEGRHEGASTSWWLERGDLRQALNRQSAPADVVFWDPFSPKVNPELWTIAAFAAARRVAGPRCTLFTYSASTAVRVGLLLGGWAVGIGDAIGSKAQTTAAAVDWRDLARPLPASWPRRLAQAGAPLPADAPADAAARVAALPQFRPAR